MHLRLDFAPRWFCAGLALLILGGGKWSLDGLIARRLGEQAPATVTKAREASFALRMF